MSFGCLKSLKFKELKNLDAFSNTNCIINIQKLSNFQLRQFQKIYSFTLERWANGSAYSGSILGKVPCVKNNNLLIFTLNLLID